MALPPNQRIINKGDWRLGIVQRSWAKSSTAEGRSTYKLNGAATVSNTYRCFANPDGVLGPLPEVEVVRTIDLDSNTFPEDIVAGTATTSSPFINVTDLFVMGPIASDENKAPHTNESGVFVFVGLTWSGTIGGGADDTWAIVRRYAEGFTLSVDAQDVFLQRYATVPANSQSFPSIVFAEGRSAFSTSTPPAPASPGDLAPKLCISIAGQAALYDTPTAGVLTAADQTGFANYFDDTSTRYMADDGAGGLIGGSLWVYPNGLNFDVVFPAAGCAKLDFGTGGALDQAQSYSSFLDMVCHQGRAVGIANAAPVIVNNTIYNDVSGPAPMAEFADNAIGYTLYPDYIVHAVTPILLHANPENTSGYGAIGSINASQLFLVKNQGGGVVINGSLSDPTIVQLPFIESTFLLNAHGINTPLGFAYASRNGIFLWTGGETVEHLSENLEGAFWNDWSEAGVTDQSHVWGITGRLAFWHPFIAVPNNYLYDIRTRAWWRLTTANPLGGSNPNMAFAYYDVSPVNGQLFMAPHHLASSNFNAQTLVAKATPQNSPGATTASLAQDWSWQSQPLVETEYETHEFLEVIIKAQRVDTTGTATLALTVSGYTESGDLIVANVTTITLPSNTLINTYRMPLGAGGSDRTFVARSVQYRIVASNSLSTGAAPLVHDIDFITSPQFGELLIYED